MSFNRTSSRLSGSMRMENEVILFYDGVCNLCHASVKFILRNEKSGRIKFAALQSAYAKSRLPEKIWNQPVAESLVLIEKGEIHEASNAALRVVPYLRFPWNMLRIFRLLPTALADRLYFFIARNRYRWFGKKDECMIPDARMKERFLDL